MEERAAENRESLLFAELRDWLRGRNAAWAFDFDGTLVDLDPDPGRVRLGPRGVVILAALARRHPCLSVSGRALADLAKRVPLRGFGLIGNHGCEIRYPDGRLWEWRSPRWEAWRRRSLDPLRRLAEARSAWVEDKRFSLTVHFKGNDFSRRWWRDRGGEELARFAGSEAELMRGQDAWNILGRGAPHKGDAVLRYCREQGYDSLLYFGDEPTDETVFALREIPVFGVKVRPGPTLARHRLESPERVLDLLERFG